MKKVLRLIMVLGLVLLGVEISPVEILKIKTINDGLTQLVAHEKSSGRTLWKSLLQVTVLPRDQAAGRQTILLQETGSGIYGAHKKNLDWVVAATYYLKDEQLIPGRSSIIFKDKTGKVVRSQERNYDTRSTLCLVDSKKQSFAYRPGLIGSEFIGPFLSNYSFEGKKDLVFYLLTFEPVVYKMTVKYRALENVTTEKGVILCHKLEMIPDLGALGLLGAFVPKTYFWFEAKAPHRFVKYEGLESGLGTPYIIEEICK